MTRDQAIKLKAMLLVYKDAGCGKHCDSCPLNLSADPKAPARCCVDLVQEHVDVPAEKPVFKTAPHDHWDAPQTPAVDDAYKHITCVSQAIRDKIDRAAKDSAKALGMTVEQFAALYTLEPQTDMDGNVFLQFKLR